MFWKNLIADLRAKDLSQADIAALALCGQATISDLAKGETGDPRHALGQRLIELSKLTKEKLQVRLATLGQTGETPSSVPQAPASTVAAGTYVGPDRRKPVAPPLPFPDLERRAFEAAKLAGQEI